MTTPIDDTPVTDAAEKARTSFNASWGKRNSTAWAPDGFDFARDLERVANRLADAADDLKKEVSRVFWTTDDLVNQREADAESLAADVSPALGKAFTKITTALRDFEELRKQISPDPNTNNT